MNNYKSITYLIIIFIFFALNNILIADTNCFELVKDIFSVHAGQRTADDFGLNKGKINKFLQDPNYFKEINNNKYPELQNCQNSVLLDNLYSLVQDKLSIWIRLAEECEKEPWYSYCSHLETYIDTDLNLQNKIAQNRNSEEFNEIFDKLDIYEEEIAIVDTYKEEATLNDIEPIKITLEELEIVPQKIEDNIETIFTQAEIVDDMNFELCLAEAKDKGLFGSHKYSFGSKVFDEINWFKILGTDKETKSKTHYTPEIINLHPYCYTPIIKYLTSRSLEWHNYKSKVCLSKKANGDSYYSITHDRNGGYIIGADLKDVQVDNSKINNVYKGSEFDYHCGYLNMGIEFLKDINANPIKTITNSFLLEIDNKYADSKFPLIDFLSTNIFFDKFNFEYYDFGNKLLRKIMLFKFDQLVGNNYNSLKLELNEAQFLKTSFNECLYENDSIENQKNCLAGIKTLLSKENKPTMIAKALANNGENILIAVNKFNIQYPEQTNNLLLLSNDTNENSQIYFKLLKYDPISANEYYKISETDTAAATVYLDLLEREFTNQANVFSTYGFYEELKKYHDLLINRNNPLAASSFMKIFIQNLEFSETASFAAGYYTAVTHSELQGNDLIEKHYYELFFHKASLDYLSLLLGNEHGNRNYQIYLAETYYDLIVIDKDKLRANRYFIALTNGIVVEMPYKLNHEELSLINNLAQTYKRDFWSTYDEQWTISNPDIHKKIIVSFCNEGNLNASKIEKIEMGYEIIFYKKAFKDFAYYYQKALNKITKRITASL
ncbi:MAG: hypothetical protein ABIA04_10175 [Pseudomonadota bacterium]